MEWIYIKKFFKDTFNKGNFKDYFNRNKVFLTVSLILVLLSFISALTVPASYARLVGAYSQQILSNGMFSVNPTLFMTSLFSLDIMVILLGVTFSVLSVLAVAINSACMGYLLSTAVHAPILNSSLLLALTLLTFVLAFTGSLLLTKIEVRILSSIVKRNFNDIFKKIKVPLKDLIMTLVLMLILIVVATLILIIL